MENKVNVPSEGFDKERNELTSCLYNKAKQRGVKFAKDNHFELDETKYFLFNRNQFVTDFENSNKELNSNVKLEDIPKKKN